MKIRLGLVVFAWLFCQLITVAQGVELYGGYPVSLKSPTEPQRVNAWNNGQAGINLSAYIRSVSISAGFGYMSHDYRVSNPNYRGSVFQHYLFVPIKVYIRAYADGKNVLSAGVGGSVKFPVTEPKASLVYMDGHTPQAFKGRFKTTVLPGITLRYTRLLLATRFFFFAEAFAEFSVMEDFYDEGSGGHGPVTPVNIPHYYSLCTLGMNAGIGYIVPIDMSTDVPRFFLRRQKKTTTP